MPWRRAAAATRVSERSVRGLSLGSSIAAGAGALGFALLAFDGCGRGPVATVTISVGTVAYESGPGSPEGPAALEGVDHSLDGGSGVVRFFGSSEVDGVVQSRMSACGDWVVYCRVVEDGDVDLFRLHRSAKAAERLTDSRSIEFDPSIDTNGVVAYARHDYSTSQSVLVLDGREIDTGASLHKATGLGERHLLAHGSRLHPGGDEHWLVVVDREDRRSTLVPSELAIRSIRTLGADRFLLEGHRLSDCREVVAVYDASVGDVSPPPRREDADAEGPAGLEGVRGRLLDSARRSLRSNDPLNNLSGGNNDLGRLSWKAAGRLGGLVDLLDAGVDRLEGLSLAAIAGRTARALIGSFSNDPSMPGWVTRKYSIDRNDELDLLVNNATVILPLLRWINSDHCRDPVLARRVVESAKTIFDRNEDLFDPSLGAAGGYRFRRGTPYRLDGACLPFNQQNVWGSALVELHRATGDARFLNRANRLARTFRNEMRTTRDGRLVWEYWPRCVLEGWTPEDGVSENTPSRTPAVDPWFEDVFHAALDVDFMIRSSEASPDSPFSEEDFDALRRTLRGMERTPSVWSHRVSGSPDAGDSPSGGGPRFRPGIGWVDLDPMWMADRHGDGWPSWRPYFDEDPFVVYARLLSVLSNRSVGGDALAEFVPEREP